ncbi:MAG: PKD domain-containing protein, partial [Candidatus Woesearchaeota archaeon]
AQCGEVTGVQSRSRTVYTCSGGSCVSSTETETRSCTVQAGSCGSGQFCSSNACYDNLRINSLTANPNEHQAPFSSEIAFSASGGREPLSYSINFGQGQSTSQSGHSTPLSDSYTRTYPAPATYTVSLSVSDSAGNSVSDSITVTAINTPPQITSFTATPEEFTASQTVTYTLTVQDASPYIDYEFTFSDSSTITGQSTNAGVNQPTTHTISVEYELPLHDLAASCSEVTLDPKDHLASVEVTDAFGLTHDDSISVTAHPIIDHETPAECVDHCDPDEAFFSDHTGEGACYHFGYVNTTLLFYETNPEGGIINVVMPIGATINLLHPVHQPIYPPVSYPSTGYYLHNPVIIGSYDIEATYLEVYHNSTSIEVERNQTTNTHLTFTERIYDENCTNEFGLCDRNAIGNNGCLVEEDYTDQELYEQQKRVLELCHPEGRNRGFEAGTLVIYERNQTHTTYASCCLDVLEPVETPRVEIETNATTLIRTQQQVMYRGRPVNLVITTFS